MNSRVTSVTSVTSGRGADFSEAYGALDAEFGPRGELEHREVVEAWLAAPPMTQSAELVRSYHLLVARDENGALAGVRDFHLVYDANKAAAVVYLAHVLVLPAYRRTGLAARFRSEPVAIAEAALTAIGKEPGAIDILVAAEMEPADLTDVPSLVRLVAYGKAGFAAILPAALPYCQPDFGLAQALARTTTLASPKNAPRPIPLLAIVRWLCHEGATSLPRKLAEAFVRHLYAVFATHVRAEHLDELMARTLQALEAYPLEDIPLLKLPRSLDDEGALVPLSRTAA